jgi:hypothetical protein
MKLKFFLRARDVGAITTAGSFFHCLAADHVSSPPLAAFV